MQTSFNNKVAFKQAFLNGLNEIYQTTLEASTVEQRYTILAKMLDESLEEGLNRTNEVVKTQGLKKTIYFSMEFLMGRLITNNLYNTGNYHIVKEVFDDWNLDLNEVENAESDAGLGNGGLGRLAACFLDSAASVGLPLYGNSLRYQHGFFMQDIQNHKQVEFPDPWLNKPFVWEKRMDSEAIEIPLFGYVEHTRLINPQWIKAVPYDVKIVGDQNGVVTTLRLWSTEPSDRQEVKSEEYIQTTRKITDSLYPDDSTEDGKTLRLMQSYVFSAAGVKAAINEHKALGRDVRELPNFYTFQINDTHPTLVIPEMMRILMDEESIGYEEAWHITQRTCAFTNHTILAEALEKWNINIFRNLLPRIYEIVAEMNRRFKFILESDGRFNREQIYLMGLIGQNHVRMAHICIYGSFSINGVAELHTNILKNIEMRNFYHLYPLKFNNKTNGITHRRWLLHTNPELVSILDETIGKEWRKDLSKLAKFDQFRFDRDAQFKVDLMKRAKKQALAKRILEDTGVELNVDSIFDIQVKRLHEYKRQLMNILHIIYVYQSLKKDNAFKESYFPHSFIFGAKAAPSYHMAKSVIELIDTVADVINNDPETNDLLKVVFVRNYNVTYAEYIMPAADLSEQISTATKEASGTGNMKFMMNGAVTIGTMDGANVEIVEKAGYENEIIFGLSAEEVTKLYTFNGYKPREIFDQDPRLQNVFQFIRKLKSNPQHFDYILNALLNSDYFLVMKDFASYVKAHEVANSAYKNRTRWLAMSISNIANSGYFTSDRTIEQYNQDIWKLKKITF
ncbi:MAG: glycogen phosphorylase [Tenericutes bacterium GWC2_34_14]|nr:MAG: glycogen phosphorylase [Tenericutes bacterium GWA2_35_7]OHE29192.1 MAG: glycogen phosphorylase [Tenericutes bacterium GWC2_34_14]OHE34275.1 MAG: glycogen phosphorylase [Tenericutes bacterium GWE2_34_108]OHE35627.1 MAG: glycogen phosphorylase [Tenericutes bacterium GWF1_35_14]OHE38842.1 MAG: glycogen phosphorylase [Tenericutes bacterium GWF2_35_184]OHE43874.1 MAG: glycogen phosphorylase [Tenericutes bacterium RIFOXYA2_FULL_36_32]OHE46313.1 MAG: glycogen phosphorylase [Tenericutes bacte